jgi:hypothetical protein
MKAWNAYQDESVNGRLLNNGPGSRVCRLALAGAIGGRLRRYQRLQVEETRGEHPADGPKNSWLTLNVPPALFIRIVAVENLRVGSSRFELVFDTLGYGYA